MADPAKVSGLQVKFLGKDTSHDTSTFKVSGLMNKFLVTDTTHDNPSFKVSGLMNKFLVTDSKFAVPETLKMSKPKLSVMWKVVSTGVMQFSVNYSAIDANLSSLTLVASTMNDNAGNPAAVIFTDITSVHITDTEDFTLKTVDEVQTLVWFTDNHLLFELTNIGSIGAGNYYIHCVDSGGNSTHNTSLVINAEE